MPDYTSKYKNRTIGNVIDVGELAVRLNSIVGYNRGGNVVFLDSFNDAVLKWNKEEGVGGGVVALSVAHPKSGSSSCVLTAGAGLVGQALIYTTFGALVTGKIGFETSFTMNPDTTVFYMQFTYYDGTNYHRGAVQYSRALNQWEYSDNTPAWRQLVAGVDLEDTLGTWHTMKLVLDT